MFTAYFARNKVATGYLLGALVTVLTLLYFAAIEAEHSALDTASSAGVEG